MFELRLGNGPGLTVREHRLANGLELLLMPDERSEVFTIMLWVRAGPRTEPEGSSGISHLLEHCYSLGSERLGPRELDRIVSELGGSKNAFTSHDATAYYANLPRGALGRMVELEADRFARLSLPPERVAKELEVVREERRLRLENAPTGRLREAVMALAYRAHPYRRPILGTSEDLASFDREAVLAYYRRHYVPANATFVVVGGFSADEAVGLFERHLGGLPATPAPASVTPPEPEQRTERRTVTELPVASTSYVAILHKAPAFEHPDTAALEVLSEVLAGDRSARLPRRLVRERRLVTSVSGGLWGLKDPSPFLITARARHGVGVEAVERGVVEVLEEVARDGIGADELDRVRAHLMVGVLASLEATSDRAQTLGRFHTSCSAGWRALERWLRRLADVGADEVQRVAATYLRPERRSVVWQLPSADVARSAMIRSACAPAPGAAAPPPPTTRRPTGEEPQAGLEAPPRVEPAPARRLEAFGERAQRAVLPNGLVLLCERLERLPVVAIALAIDAGSAFDPPGASGLAALTAALLPTGTERYDEEALGREFGALGASLAIARGADLVQPSVYVGAGALERALELLAEVLIRPRLGGDKLERLRVEHISRRRARRADPAERMAEAFARVVFGEGHPYGRPVGGTPRGLEAVSLEAVREHYRGCYTPGRVRLAVTGAIDPARLEDTVERLFGSWRGPRAGERMAAAIPGPRALAGSVLVPIPGVNQAHLRLGRRLFPRSHPDWDALTLLNAVLGSGGLSARLPAKVRTEEGLAYSAGSFLIGRRLDGALCLRAETRSGSCSRALELLGEELTRLCAEPVAPDELERLKARVSGTLPFRQETTGQRAAALLSAEVFGLDPDYQREQVEHLSRLSAADLYAAAQRHLVPERFTPLVVGDAAALTGELGARGPLTIMGEDELDGG